MTQKVKLPAFNEFKDGFLKPQNTIKNSIILFISYLCSIKYCDFTELWDIVNPLVCHYELWKIIDSYYATCPSRKMKFGFKDLKILSIHYSH